MIRIGLKLRAKRFRHLPLDAFAEDLKSQTQIIILSSVNNGSRVPRLQKLLPNIFQ